MAYTHSNNSISTFGSKIISIDASYTETFREINAAADTFGLANVPFQGSNITGWYLISVPEISANAITTTTDLSGQTMTNIFRNLHNIDIIPHFLSFASIDHSNINKLFKTNFPLSNNGIIDPSRWTKVNDPSGHNFTTNLLPQLNSQKLYGHLGYFVYLMFITYNWTNLYWDLRYCVQDISQVTSFTTTVSHVPLQGDLNDTDSTYGYPQFFTREKPNLADSNKVKENYVVKNISATAKYSDKKLILPLESFVSNTVLRIHNKFESIAKNNVDNSLSMNNPLNTDVSFSAQLITQQGIVHDNDSQSQTYNLRHIITQIPNSSIQFEIIGFIANSETYVVLGFKNPNSDKTNVNNILTSNFHKYITTKAVEELVNIMVVDNNEVKTHSNGNPSNLSAYISSLQSSLNLDVSLSVYNFDDEQVETTINSKTLTNIHLIITPVIWLNGGSQNAINGGATIYLTKKIADKSLKTDFESKSVPGTVTKDNLSGLQGMVGIGVDAALGAIGGYVKFDPVYKQDDLQEVIKQFENQLTNSDSPVFIETIQASQFVTADVSDGHYVITRYTHF